MNRSALGIVVTALSISMAFMPADAFDFTLEIYGNANMDDTIDELDIEYVQGIIDGTNGETELADANFDGQIDEADLEQIQLILDGSETKLTYFDMLGEPETVNKPIKRLVNMGFNGVEMTRILGAEDILVAHGQDRTAHKTYFPKFAELPSVGNTAENADFELILSLEPDALQTNIESGHTSPGGLEQKQIFRQNLPGVPIISLEMREPDTLVKFDSHDVFQ
jgi:iron complex transport system substrate-binding protein